VRTAKWTTAAAAVHTNSTRMMTVQGDIFGNECSSALCSLTDMELSALGWLECQWLLLLLTFAGDVCQLLGALSECLCYSMTADTHKHKHKYIIFCLLCLLPSLPLLQFSDIHYGTDCTVAWSATGGLLWVRWWTSGFHKMWGISWLAEELLASQEGLCSMELVT